MSASFSNARPNRRKLTPIPNWLPWDTTAPAVPPMIAPRIWPATAPIWYFWALLACAVPCRSATWAISWAITPTTSPSVFAASIIPRFTYIGPPGNANALISFKSMTLKLYSNSGCRRSAGIVSTSRSPSSSTYEDTRSSRSTGICRSTSTDASRPSLMSSAGSYLFFGAFTRVCASDCVAKTATRARTARGRRVMRVLMLCSIFISWPSHAWSTASSVAGCAGTEVPATTSWVGGTAAGVGSRGRARARSALAVGELRLLFLDLAGLDPHLAVFLRDGAGDAGLGFLRALMAGFVGRRVLRDVVLGRRTLIVFHHEHILALAGVGLLQSALRAHHRARQRRLGGLGHRRHCQHDRQSHSGP